MKTADIQIANSGVAGKPTIAVRRVLLASFLFCLPFSQALTVNILFPLKLSEVFLFLLIFHDLITANVFKWRLPKAVAIWGLAFIGVILSSVIVNAFYTYPYPLTLEVTRFNPVVDCVLKYFYIIIAFCAMLFTFNGLTQYPQYIKYFFGGALVSSFYAWYLLASGILHLPTLLLPGMDAGSQTFDLGFAQVVRCSTFKEGNYMGFYLLVCGILALQYKRNKYALFFFVTIITTFSTTSIFCSMVFLVAYLIYKYRQHKVKLLGALVAIAMVLGLLMQFSEGFRQVFYNKIFGTEDTVENANDIFSKTERLNTVVVALQMSADNPVFGVGPANFGLHFNHYNTIDAFEQEVKKIPNNIYVEVLSESGFVALLMFLIFLFVILRQTAKRKQIVLLVGLVASFIYFFAFPTFTMLFIWVFFGVVLAQKPNFKVN